MMPAPLAKPSRLDRDVLKWQRRLLKDKVKRTRVRVEQDRWRRISQAIEFRDRGRCRVCGAFTQKPPCDPRLIGAAHHITYRSAGGSDDFSNLVWVDAGCHDDEHGGRITLTGTAHKLVITRRPS